jgi:chromosomal replication initiation ATPase DnaA
MHYQIFSSYVSHVCDAYSISPDALFVKSKRRDIVDARQLLYFLCSESPMRIRYIQQYMEENGYKVGHSTIIHGIKQVKEKKKSDSIFDRESNRIRLTSIM